MVVQLRVHLAHKDEFAMVVSAYNAPQGIDTPLSIAVSARVLVDLTPPEAGFALDIEPCALNSTECALNAGGIVEFLLPTDLVAARWDGFVDPESEVVSYEYCIGSSKLACDLAPMVQVVNATGMQTQLDSTAEHGQTLCVSVEAINGVGLRSDRVSSGCIRIDNTPPVMNAVRISSDPKIHMEEQGSADIVFGVAIAADDISYAVAA